jgi:hypothetical protein
MSSAILALCLSAAAILHSAQAAVKIHPDFLSPTEIQTWREAAMQIDPLAEGAVASASNTCSTAGTSVTCKISPLDGTSREKCSQLVMIDAGLHRRIIAALMGNHGGSVHAGDTQGKDGEHTAANSDGDEHDVDTCDASGVCQQAEVGAQVRVSKIYRSTRPHQDHYVHTNKVSTIQTV